VEPRPRESCADLHEEPAKRAEKTDPILRHDRFVGSDEDGVSHEHRSEPSERLDRASASERSNQLW
jgi:hypothetical protein